MFAVVDEWNTLLNSANSPILQGGMQFDGIAFTVPKNGTYFIYGMLTSEQESNNADCVWEIGIEKTDRLTMNGVGESSKKIGLFASLVFELSEGDEVSMTAFVCRYNFAPEMSFFGLYRLQ